MNLITLGEAKREFAESVRYYEAKEAGLGVRISLSFARKLRAPRDHEATRGSHARATPPRSQERVLMDDLLPAAIVMLSCSGPSTAAVSLWDSASLIIPFKRAWRVRRVSCLE